MIERSIVFRGGTLIDGIGNNPVYNAVIVIRGSKIVDVGEENIVDVPADAEVHTLHENNIIMPGLIDAHLHFNMGFDGEEEALRAIRAVAEARTLLEAGYTTVRCCGSKITPSLKKAIEEGKVPGPRIMASRLIITRTGGHECHSIPLHWVKEAGIVRLADGMNDCRLAVREQLRGGADFIKLVAGLSGESKRFPKPSPGYTFDEVKAIVDEAHLAGVKTAAHVHGKEGIMYSLMAGIDTIEHAQFLDEENAQMMVEKNIIYVPTLAFTPVPMPLKFKNVWEDILYPNMIESVKIARDAGVKIAAGSDFGGAGLPMGNNAIELELLMTSGFSSMDSIVAATKISSEALGLEEQIGTIEPGKLADMIIVEDNPLEDIRILQNKKKIKMIMKNGKIAVNRGRHNI